MATITTDAGRRVALDRIRVPENVRVLDPEHVKALAGWRPIPNRPRARDTDRPDAPALWPRRNRTP